MGRLWDNCHYFAILGRPWIDCCMWKFVRKAFGIGPKEYLYLLGVEYGIPEHEQFGSCTTTSIPMYWLYRVNKAKDDKFSARHFRIGGSIGFQKVDGELTEEEMLMSDWELQRVLKLRHLPWVVEYEESMEGRTFKDGAGI